MIRMSKILKLLMGLLLVFIFITIIARFTPVPTILLSKKMKITSDELANGLTILDMFLAVLMAAYASKEQNKLAQRCIYDFSVAKDNLSFEGYCRFPSVHEDVFTYECDIEASNIERPYYGMDISIEEKGICSGGVPLQMKVITQLDIKSLTFSNVQAYTRCSEIVRKSKKLAHGTVIQRTIQDGMAFLVRMQLLTNRELYQEILESRIFLNFVITVEDDRGKKYKKYIMLNTQNVNGEGRDLSVKSENHYLKYIWELMKLRYQLYQSGKRYCTDGCS